MATENKGIQPLSDEAIRAFLLGRLDAEAQANFEAELIGSDQLEARVRQAELYLTDDFVGHRLDRFDRQRFMKSFLLTAERRRTWLVSNALPRKAPPEFGCLLSPRRRTPPLTLDEKVADGGPVLGTPE